MSPKITVLRTNQDILRKALVTEQDFTTKQQIRQALSEVSDKIKKEAKTILERNN